MAHKGTSNRTHLEQQQQRQMALAQPGETTRTILGKSMGSWALGNQAFAHSRPAFIVCLHRRQTEWLSQIKQRQTIQCVVAEVLGDAGQDWHRLTSTRTTARQTFIFTGELAEQSAILDFAGNGPRGFAASGCQWRLSDTIREWPRLTLAKQPAGGVFAVSDNVK